MQYYHPSDQTKTLDVYLRSRRSQQKGTFYLHSCRFRFGCRQVALDKDRRLKIFKANEIERRVITLLIDSDTSVAVVSYAQLRFSFNKTQGWIQDPGWIQDQLQGGVLSLKGTLTRKRLSPPKKISSKKKKVIKYWISSKLQQAQGGLHPLESKGEKPIFCWLPQK